MTVKNWMLQGYLPEPEGFYESEKEAERSHHTHAWWKVMCLTGVDYFSTLGYQPGIAALAAGALSPFATLVLVLLTLLGAFPIYRKVAQESPHGEGSISMLERLLSYWNGKLLVLILLGFIATDFIITITLSAADAAGHVLENRFLEHLFHGAPTLWQVLITLGLILLLGAVFLKGFKEAIGIAVALVVLYLSLNAVVIGRGLMEILAHPRHFPEWREMLFAQHGSIPAIVLGALLIFPKLALGLSGFETGVAIMPLVEGSARETDSGPGSRIANTRKLLLSAALIMSVYLLASSLVTTLLIPPRTFLPRLEGHQTITPAQLSAGRVKLTLRPDLPATEPVMEVTLPPQPGARVGTFSAPGRVVVGPPTTAEVTVSVHVRGDRLEARGQLAKGEANGRALAYLAVELFGPRVGPLFGTLYDISTILILWFAGASAMAGLLNIVPRYLPRYGMAPEWTRANRPLVLVYTLVALAVTLIFKANVDAQGGAYATGVLVLMTSAAVAVTIAVKHQDQRMATLIFGAISAVFLYTTAMNVVERPDGVKIASFFIGTILLISTISRVWRTTELRVDKVEFDAKAEQMIREMAYSGEIRFIANHPDQTDAAEYSRAIRDASWTHHFREEERWAFLEVYIQDASAFSSTLRVEGVDVGGFWVFRCHGVAVPNAIAAFLLEVQKRTKGRRPHVYFHWIESSPLLFLAKFFLSGQGDVAPLTHEILRRAQPEPGQRPVVHAAG